jgi:hypothetical protein
MERVGQVAGGGAGRGRGWERGGLERRRARAARRRYRHDQDAVLGQRRLGAVPALVAPTALGPLDRLIARPDEPGAFAAAAAPDRVRGRAGLPEGLRRRTVAVLPCVGNGGVRPRADALFREPGVLRRLGGRPPQVRQGDSAQQRHPAGRVTEAAWLAARQAVAAWRYLGGRRRSRARRRPSRASSARGASRRAGRGASRCPRPLPAPPMARSWPGGRTATASPPWCACPPPACSTRTRRGARRAGG